MTLEEFYKDVMRTFPPITGWEHELVTTALGLTGEAGEFADLVKKWHAQGHPLDRNKLERELGDVAVYFMVGCRALGLTPAQVLLRNVQKRAIRYPDGFEVTRSINRKYGDT